MSWFWKIIWLRIPHHQHTILLTSFVLYLRLHSYPEALAFISSDSFCSLLNWNVLNHILQHKWNASFLVIQIGVHRLFWVSVFTMSSVECIMTVLSVMLLFVGKTLTKPSTGSFKPRLQLPEIKVGTHTHGYVFSERLSSCHVTRGRKTTLLIHSHQTERKWSMLESPDRVERVNTLPI